MHRYSVHPVIYSLHTSGEGKEYGEGRDKSLHRGGESWSEHMVISMDGHRGIDIDFDIIGCYLL